MNRVKYCLKLGCAFASLLQTCSMPCVQNFTIEQIKNVLNQASSVQEAVLTLQSNELDALIQFMQQLSPKFPFKLIDQTFERNLKEPVSSVLYVLTSNPSLSTEARDYLFEYCLDANLEIPTYPDVPESVLRLSSEHLLLIESRIFAKHLKSRSHDDSSFRLFLDACYQAHSVYLVDLILRAMEQLLNFDQSESTINQIIDWVSISLEREDQMRIYLVSQSKSRIRDLSLSLPRFGQLVLQLFDQKMQIEPFNGCPTSEEMFDLIHCLASEEPFREQLVNAVHKLAQTEPIGNHFWKSIVCQMQR